MAPDGERLTIDQIVIKFATPKAMFDTQLPIIDVGHNLATRLGFVPTVLYAKPVQR